MATRIGAAMGDELRAVGVNFDFAGCRFGNLSPDNPIIYRRSFGVDPTLVSPMVAAFVTGMQSAGVMTTAKHCPVMATPVNSRASYRWLICHVIA